jgi:hypothetical protein
MADALAAGADAPAVAVTARTSAFTRCGSARSSSAAISTRTGSAHMVSATTSNSGPASTTSVRPLTPELVECASTSRRSMSLAVFGGSAVT